MDVLWRIGPGALGNHAAHAVSQHHIASTALAAQQRRERLRTQVDAKTDRQRRQAIAWCVPGHHAVAGCRKCCDLAAPVFLGAKRTVQQKHSGAIGGTVRMGDAEVDRWHGAGNGLGDGAHRATPWASLIGIQ